MNKAFITVSMSLILMIGYPSTITYGIHPANNYKDTISTELYEESLIAVLYPYISEAVYKYYGGFKQFDFVDIQSIKKTPNLNQYEIILQVETFSGSHNPPRGKETLTIITSAMGTKVVSFKHKSE
jgi:hypothetical protein